MELDPSKQERKMLKQPPGFSEQVSFIVRQVINVNTTDYHDRINGFRTATAKSLETDRSGKDLFAFSRVAQCDSQQRLMLMETGAMAPSWLFKLGFDFEFNPVCFLAAEGGIEECSSTFDGLGGINYCTDADNAQSTTEEHAQSRGVYQRSSHDHLG